VQASPRHRHPSASARAWTPARTRPGGHLHRGESL